MGAARERRRAVPPDLRSDADHAESEQQDRAFPLPKQFGDEQSGLALDPALAPLDDDENAASGKAARNNAADRGTLSRAALMGRGAKSGNPKGATQKSSAGPGIGGAGQRRAESVPGQDRGLTLGQEKSPAESLLIKESNNRSEVGRGYGSALLAPNERPPDQRNSQSAKDGPSDSPPAAPGLAARLTSGLKKQAADAKARWSAGRSSPDEPTPSGSTPSRKPARAERSGARPSAQAARYDRYQDSYSQRDEAPLFAPEPDPRTADSRRGDGAYGADAEPQGIGGGVKARTGEGRALVATDFASPALRPTERLMRFAYRLGVPAHTMRSPFRKPARPRLLATVSSPLRGDRAAGVALRAGHFLIFGVKAPIAQLDFKSGGSLSPPFQRTVHGFTWLADLAASAPREQCLPTAERIIGRWLAANPKPGKGAAWTTELAGLRLLNWLVYAPLVLGGKDHAQRERALNAITDTARWLDRHVRRSPDHIGELAGWSAIVAAGLLLVDGRARRLFGEAGLVHCLGDLVSEDGGVLSRSPLAQMQAIALLIDLSACYHAVGEDPPEAVQKMLDMLVPPLLVLVHSDGALGSWQGGGPIDQTRLAELIEASGVRTRPLKDVREWGYQRIAAGRTVLQFDAAPPPLSRHARDGCASTLAFEMSSGADRLIVNCGGAAMTGGQVPSRIEQGLRATAAHSTLVLSDVNSTAILPGGGLGAGVSEVEVDRRVLDLKHGRATRLEASHNGYVAGFGLVHRRVLILRDNGEELRGEDMLIPSGRRGKTGKVAYAIRFHLGPEVEAMLSEDERGAWLALADSSHWQFRIPQGKLALEESLWVDGDGRPRPIQQIVIQGMVARGGGSFSWLLKKMG